MVCVPQDQQLEIHEQLMQHMGSADGDLAPSAPAADYDADAPPAEDEYNPDVSSGRDL